MISEQIVLNKKSKKVKAKKITSSETVTCCQSSNGTVAALRTTSDNFRKFPEKRL